MRRPKVIGIETRYAGSIKLFRGQSVHVASIIRGSIRDRARRIPEVTDDEELWLRPVAPEDDVRIRINGVLPKVVRATELECFRYVAVSALVPVEVRLEENVLAEAREAARMARKSLDEALTKHLRSIGLLRGPSGEVYARGEEQRMGGQT